MVGFTYFDEIPVEPQPTIAELIASLTGGQKGVILDGFTKRIKPIVLARRILLNENVVIRLYDQIDQMQSLSRSLMRGEVVVTPAVIDPETGEVTQEAVYNTPPSTALQLLNAVQNEFEDSFTSAQVEAILTRMVEYSKYDGTGDWAYYKTEVVK